jgi:hypothetical protein
VWCCAALHCAVRFGAPCRGMLRCLGGAVLRCVARGIVLRYTVRCGAVWCGAVWRDAVRVALRYTKRGVVLRALCGVERCGAVAAVWCGAVRCDTAMH